MELKAIKEEASAILVECRDKLEARGLSYALIAVAPDNSMISTTEIKEGQNEEIKTMLSVVESASNPETFPYVADILELGTRTLLDKADPKFLARARTSLLSKLVTMKKEEAKEEEE